MPMNAEALARALREADGLLPCVADKITAELLATPGRKTKIVANYGVGYNNIDVAAAKANGVVVTNTPDVLTEDTADLALTLMLATARRAGEGERELRGGKWTGWRPTHMLATQVHGKTLGLIGIGRIGRAVARRAHSGFGMKIIYHDPYPLSDADAAALGAERKDSIEAVLSESDFVSLHCPATPETKHLMNASRFAQMKKGSILINTARGDVVNETDLIAALERGNDRGRRPRCVREGAPGAGGAHEHGERRAAAASWQRDDGGARRDGDARDRQSRGLLRRHGAARPRRLTMWQRI